MGTTRPVVVMATDSLRNLHSYVLDAWSKAVQSVSDTGTAMYSTYIPTACSFSQAVQFPVVAAFAAEGPRLLSVALQTPKEPLLQVISLLLLR